MTTDTALATSAGRPTNAWLKAAAVPAVLVGALNVVGAFLFVDFTSAIGVALGVALIGGGVALGVSAVLVATGRERALPVLAAVLVLDAVWNIKKVFFEGETESAMFLIGIALTTALLVMGRRALRR